MADVYAGIGNYLARSKDIGLGPVLDEIADEIEQYAVGLAVEHVESGDYIESIRTVIDRQSPSGRDRFVSSDDPGALAIEYGHDLVDDDGNVVSHVAGQHIFGRAAEAVRGQH
jgi:hypothetical protein